MKINNPKNHFVIFLFAGIKLAKQNLRKIWKCDDREEKYLWKNNFAKINNREKIVQNLGKLKHATCYSLSFFTFQKIFDFFSLPQCVVDFLPATMQGSTTSPFQRQRPLTSGIRRPNKYLFFYTCLCFVCVAMALVPFFFPKVAERKATNYEAP